MSAKVIDFFSRRPLQTRQDTEENDRTTSEEGRYIGNIGKTNAEAFMSIVAVLERLAQEMFLLSEEFSEMDSTHWENTNRIIKMLDAVEKFDPDEEELRVSEDGHVWVVKSEKFDDIE